MKKFFLSLATVALSVASVFAQDVTFNFTGTGDVYGLTRSSSMTKYIDSPTTITQDNIVVELTNTGSGFVLYSGGFLMSSGTNHIIVSSTNGATITAVQVNMSRTGVGVGLSAEEGAVRNSGMNRIWEGESKNLDLTMTGNGNRITSFVISYEGGGNVKESAGINFEENSAEVLLGSEFSAPVLSNPNNVTVTWESSDTNVATVAADGDVTIVGAGKTIITASSEENDSYLAGKATYTLTVVPVAKTISELLSNAAVNGEKAYIDMPLTVVYATPIAMYVIDEEGGATLLNISNNLEVGSVIPAGWMATNSSTSTTAQFTGKLPEGVYTTTEVTYPKVDTITKADNNRVLILSKVNFAEPTESDNSMTFVGTLADGTKYTFKNQFMIDATDAGVYDVTLAVKAWYSSMYDEDKYELYPIAYALPQAGPSEPTLVEKSEILDFTVMDMPAASTAIPASELPRTYEAKAFTYTLVSGTNTSAPFREREGNGIMLPKGTEVMTVNSGDKQISKIDIKISASVYDWSSKVGEIKGNGILFECDEDSDPEYYTHYVWTAPENETVYEVNIESIVGTNQWIKTVTVYYLAQTSGLPMADLSLTQTNATVSKAESPFDPSSYLVNPYNVPVKWTSSNEEIAVATSEGIELKAAGTVTLTASVASDEYEPEEIDFTLIVIDAAMALDQMIVLAPEAGDKVKIYDTLPLYLSAFVSGTYNATVAQEDGSEKEVTYWESYMFLEDKNGNPVLFTTNERTTKPGYRVDDLFGGGYTATNVSEGDMTLWKGLPLNDTRAMGWFDNRNYVESLAGVELNKIVILKNVSLAYGVPASKGEFEGTVDGEDLTLKNLVNGTRQLSGVYNILGAPGVTPEGKLVFYPVEYTLVQELDPIFPTALDVTTDSENASVTVDMEEKTITISGTTDQEDGITVKVEVPAGWSNVISMIMTEAEDYEFSSLSVRREEAEWVPVESLTASGKFKLGSVITIPNKEATGSVSFVYGDKADMGNYFQINSNVTYESDPTAVEVIEAVEADAVYYTLQGIEVKNPAHGIYVKVLNGKATKVAIK